MNELQLTLAILSGVAVLLLLIIRLKFNAFLSLLIASIWVGIASGLGLDVIIETISSGMGNTLAFVATIVGLGAIFGAMLEHSGGAIALAKYLLKKAGETRSRLALLVTGFIVSIPVFFDVGIIILMPIVNALSKKSGKHTLYFALPLLTGLGITHSFIPPTPGPVAVAKILSVDLGYAILIGSAIGIPIALICGLIMSKWITPKFVETPITSEKMSDELDLGLVKKIFWVLGLPIVMIIVGSLFNTLVGEGVLEPHKAYEIMGFIGHPFIALTLATLMAIYFLGTKRGVSKDELSEVAQKSLSPAGSILLITGAGGVLKQMMITTGIGEMIASAMQNGSISILLLAYLVTVLVRAMQGSATVAMLTGAGIVAAIIPGMELTMMDKTLIMMAIAAGSIVLSHVNDSGFWLVNRYLNQNVQQTLRSWTIQSTLISVTSFVLVYVAYLFL